jgi:hypothetical protein
MTLEERSDAILEWAFEHLEDKDEDGEPKVNNLALLVNVSRSLLKWRRLAGAYDGTWITLGGGSNGEEGFDDLTELDRRGVMAGCNKIGTQPTLDEIPSCWDEKLPGWLDELEQLKRDTLEGAVN